MAARSVDDRLALDGGTPAVRDPLPPMYPGGMRIGQEERHAVLRVLDGKRLFRYYGPGDTSSMVAEFEATFGSRMGAAHVLAVSSGTNALTGALAAFGVGIRDEVIVPAYTWIATAAAVTAVGAVPVIADVDESLSLDPADTERKITPRTRAIIPVHMRGAPADMDALSAIGRRHGVNLLEDTAQALGGSYRGRRLGTIGDAGAYSLQFNKILTCGEGGIITTGSSTLHRRATMYHDVAASQRKGSATESTFVGTTCRMSELQGAVALAQLDRLEDILSATRLHKTAIKTAVADLAQRKGITFRRLNDDAGDTAIALVFYLPEAKLAHHVTKALNAEGADAEVLFDPRAPDYHIAYHWTPLRAKQSWSAASPWDLHDGEIGYDPATYPHALDLLSRAVHLDISPDLTKQQTDDIAHALHKVFSSI